MFPFLGSLFTGGMGLLGSLFSSDTAAENNERNIAMQKETNLMQAAEAQKNRDFQQQMSSTAYQRASQDMQSAGLNPMAMFGSGSAASTPGGAQASFSAPKATENPGRSFEQLGDVASKAVSSAQTIKNLDLMTAQEDKTRSEEHLNDTTVLQKRQETVNAAVQQGVLTEERGKRAAERIIKENEAVTAKNLQGIDPDVRKAGDVYSWGASKGKETADLVGTLISSALRARQFRPQRSTIERSNNRGDSSFEERFNY